MIKKNRLNPVRPTEPILPKQADKNLINYKLV